MARIAINLGSFKLVWWSCVLSARAGAEWIGFGVLAAAVALHLFLSRSRGSEARLLALAAVIGYCVDSIAGLTGTLVFEAGRQPAFLAPLWVAALWMNFATTLNTSLRWLRNRVWMAVAMGAASGPMAYAAGAALGIVSIPNPITGVAILAVLWGVTLPVLVRIASRAVVATNAVSTDPGECAGEIT